MLAPLIVAGLSALAGLGAYALTKEKKDDDDDTPKGDIIDLDSERKKSYDTGAAEERGRIKKENERLDSLREAAREGARLERKSRQKDGA